MPRPLQAIIRSNVLGLRQFRLPYPVVHLLSKTRPLLGSNRIHRRSNRTTPDASRSHQPVVPSSLSAALGGRPQTAAPANRGGPANGGGPTPSALQEWRTAFSGTAQARFAIYIFFPCSCKTRISNAVLVLSQTPPGGPRCHLQLASYVSRHFETSSRRSIAQQQQ